MNTPTPESQTRSSTQTIIVTIIAVVGGAILIGGLIAFALSLTSSRAVPEQQATADATGVTSLDIDVSAGEFTLQFSDVDEARLDATNAPGQWDVRRSDDTLIVHSPNRSWLDFCFLGCEHQTAVLTLPAELQESGELRGDLELSAGELRASGSFEELALQVSAGSLIVDASAETVVGGVSAGELVGVLENVRSGNFRVSAGSTDLRLDGSAPDELDVRVSAGSIDLVLPDAEYRVDSDVSAGDVRNDLRTGSRSNHVIRVDVSAGSVSLRN